ncbi:MFS transporter [Deinococcus yunweiensis]|uniref:MFS transporter n=1 Tax=Deinococcus yunweiensis TaxID=367282 RepID=UPI00398EAF0B
MPAQPNAVPTTVAPGSRTAVGSDPPALRSQPDFLKLWGSETVSMFGTAITTLALPLTAITLLDATPAQMGMLGAAQFLPFLLLSLPLGVWVDRRARRPLMILANVGRAALLAMIPLAAAAGWLRMDTLYPVALIAGTLDVLFHLSYSAYLPGLVGTARLVQGNSSLQASASVAEIAGPGLAGVLIGWLGAPGALLLDAGSYVLSALGISSIRHRELPPARAERPVHLLTEVREGLGLVFRHPMLRAMVIEAAIFNGAMQALGTLFVLYATRDLHLSPAQIGLIFGAGGVGALLGSVFAGPLARRVGFGRALVLAAALACVAPLLVPAIHGTPAITVPLLMLAYALEGVGVAASSIHHLSLRQALTPPELLGRMSASYRTVTYGVLPLGALLFGVLGQHVGLNAALWVGTAVTATGWLGVRFSPVWPLRQLPEG